METKDGNKHATRATEQYMPSYKYLLQHQQRFPSISHSHIKSVGFKVQSKMSKSRQAIQQSQVQAATQQNLNTVNLSYFALPQQSSASNLSFKVQNRIKSSMSRQYLMKSHSGTINHKSHHVTKRKKFIPETLKSQNTHTIVSQFMNSHNHYSTNFQKIKNSKLA